MNTLVIQQGDHPAMLMVLEPGNIERLKQGHPISKRIEDFFPDGVPEKLEVLIFFSETPVADAKEFSKMSQKTIDERTPEIQARRPHCPECKSTLEQLGVWRNESLIAIVFCSQCGCIFGTVPSEIMRSLIP
jgi:hypothetical protein